MIERLTREITGSRIRRFAPCVLACIAISLALSFGSTVARAQPDAGTPPPNSSGYIYLYDKDLSRERDWITVSIGMPAPLHPSEWCDSGSSSN